MSAKEKAEEEERKLRYENEIKAKEALKKAEHDKNLKQMKDAHNNYENHMKERAEKEKSYKYIKEPALYQTLEDRYQKNVYLPNLE